MHQRESKIEAASHASAVGAHSTISGAGQADALEQFAGAGARPLLLDAIQHGLKFQQLVAGHQRIDRRILQRDTDPLAHLRRRVDDVEPGNRRGA